MILSDQDEHSIQNSKIIIYVRKQYIRSILSCIHIYDIYTFSHHRRLDLRERERDEEKKNDSQRSGRT